MALFARRALKRMLDHLSAQLSEESCQKLADGLNQPSTAPLGFEWETALLFGFSQLGKVGRGLAFVANAQAARQIAASLGRVALEAQQSSPLMMSAEKVVQYGAKQDAFGEAVLLQLVSEDGVPYMFGLPLAAAADLGARLQSESAKASKTGRA
jgi:hypothetical protein